MAVQLLKDRTRLTSDPVRNFKFQVEFLHPDDRLSKGLGIMGFVGVDGLAMSTEMVTYREGGWNAQPLSSKVLTRSGWKTMGDLEVGDRVIAPNGDDSKVTGIYPKGERDVYRVTLRDGSTTLACNEHLWKVKATSHYLDKVMDTTEMLDYLERGHPVWLPEISPVEFDSLDELPIHPYLMGVLLSEGYLGEKVVRFTQATADESGRQMVERVRSVLPEGVVLTPFGVDCFSITTGKATTSPNTTSHYNRNPVMAAIRELGLENHGSHDKFIPEIYKCATPEERLALLQGIMDGDGWITETGRIGFASASEQFRDDVIDVINSLGGRATKGYVTGVTYTSPTQVEPKAASDSYTIASAQMYLNPFSIERKASRFQPKNAAYHRAVVSVEPAGREEVQCIMVSSDEHLYITDDYIPTHNTNPHKLPGMTDFAPLTLTAGVFANKPGMWNLAKQMFAVQWGNGTIGIGEDFRFDMTIRVLDHPVTRGDASGVQGKPDGAVMAYQVYNAWVGSVAFGGLNAMDNQVLIHNMTIHHEGFDTFWGNSDAVRLTHTS